ncbi:MAG: RNA polymerase factor sigma-54 [Candidatus Omnitrophota bacterium]
MKSSLLLSQKQKQVLLPQLREAIEILQLPILELEMHIEQQMVSNPLLEAEDASRAESPDNAGPEPDKDIKDIADYGPDSAGEGLDGYQDPAWQKEQGKKRRLQEALITNAPSLQEELFKQLRMLNLLGQDLGIAEKIIENINRDGYLDADLQAIANDTAGGDIKKAEKVLFIIQTFEPIGVGARDIPECLLIQLRARGKEDSQAVRAIRECWKLLEQGKYKQVSKKLGCDAEQVKSILGEISKLDLHPGASYDHFRPVTVIPDMELRYTPAGYKVLLKDRQLPVLRINNKYRRMLKDKRVSEENKKFIKDKLNSARWLIEAIKQRNDTLKRVAQHIVDAQKKFLKKKSAYLNPLTIKDVARKTGLHDSTVSRVVANKYIETPAGTIKLRDLFSGAAGGRTGTDQSADMVEVRIRRIVDKEDKTKPLGDEAIAAALSEKGIKVARRTVTKYRRQMGILPSYLRKH